MTQDKRLVEILTAQMSDCPEGAIGVAVSGGGDSMALLHLMMQWAKSQNRTLKIATVDHKLRPEAANEAADVAAFCHAQGVAHQTLCWTDWNGQGNLQQAARLARKDLLAQWAQKNALSAICLGHTQDDQAETFLMRLARGSGVDGLAAMTRKAGSDPVWFRPLLDVSRSELREYLQEHDLSWIDDPSNEDESFDRIKFRKAQDMLDDLGLSRKRLAQTADAMQLARHALEIETQNLAQSCATVSELGYITIDLPQLAQASEELRLRLLSHAIKWVSSAHFRPRLTALKDVYAHLERGTAQTLGGCYLCFQSPDTLLVLREVAAMPQTPVPDQPYDQRWQIETIKPDDQLLCRSVGKDGILQLDHWRETGLPRDVVMQLPSIWSEGDILAVPQVLKHAEFRLSLKTSPKSFVFSIVSH